MMDYSWYLEETKPMILDTEQQRAFLLEMFKQVQFPGAVLEAAHDVLQAVKQAEVTNPAAPPIPTMGRQE